MVDHPRPRRRETDPDAAILFAIYDRKGEPLRICAGAKRPIAFKTSADDKGTVLLSLKRVK